MSKATTITNNKNMLKEQLEKGILKYSKGLYRNL
jgi:hypothetical protein